MHPGLRISRLQRPDDYPFSFDSPYKKTVYLWKNRVFFFAALAPWSARELPNCASVSRSAPPDEFSFILFREIRIGLRGARPVRDAKRGLL